MIIWAKAIDELAFFFLPLDLNNDVDQIATAMNLN